MIKKNLTSSIILVMMLLITPCVSAQTYRQIKGWSKEVNDRLEDFLNSTITMKIRKVAVFDGDGTVMGQVPHYLADEALYQYADEHFKGKTDKFSKEKMAILNRKNALFYKTQHGAYIGDMFMSLIHTCRLGSINPFDYLVSLQKHSSTVFRNPQNWLPWNYQASLPNNDS